MNITKGLRKPDTGQILFYFTLTHESNSHLSRDIMEFFSCIEDLENRHKNSDYVWPLNCGSRCLEPAFTNQMKPFHQ